MWESTVRKSGEGWGTRRGARKGLFVSFEFSADALREVDAFFRREHRVIVPLTVREILDESIAKKLI